MSKLRELKSVILAEGEDLRIDDADMALIRERLPAEGALGSDDLMVLAGLRSEARVVCPAFDALFFPALKSWLLADGKISLPEQFVLLRILYGGGGIDLAERKFLLELRKEVRETTPEFDALPPGSPRFPRPRRRQRDRHVRAIATRLDGESNFRSGSRATLRSSRSLVSEARLERAKRVAAAPSRTSPASGDERVPSAPNSHHV